MEIKLDKGQIFNSDTFSVLISAGIENGVLLAFLKKNRVKLNLL